MSEYLQHVGRRAELRQELIQVNIAADSHRESLRLALDPTAPVDTLDAGKIISLAAALSEKITVAWELKANLAAIEKIIGK